MKKINNFIVLITLIISTSFSVFAQYSKDLEKDAQKGITDAQANLGYCYLVGDGVRQDISKAKDWLWKAAIRDCAPAQNMLANIYYEYDQDYEQAAEWYKKAANKGIPASQYMLANLLFDGLGIEQNKEQAFSWYKNAGEQNLPEAQFSLGICYEYGYGVNADIDKAIIWYRKAAEQNISEAQNALGLCYMNKIEPKDYKQAAKWFHSAAQNGFVSAQSNLGVLYSRGLGVEQDNQKAIYWLQKAANQNYFIAKYELGLCYYKLNDYSNALNLLLDVFYNSKGTANLKQYASQLIGIMYYKGEGVTHDKIEAFFFLNCGVGTGVALVGGDYSGQALNLLSKCYRFGYGTEKDIEKSDHLLQLAAHNGNSNAEMILNLLK